MQDIVRVDLSERSYDIVIGPGAIRQAGARIAPLIGRRPVIIVTDDTVAPLHLPALEAALEDFAGCAVIISHDRFFLDRLCTHILAFEGDAHVEWFEGNFEAYEEDKVRRLGPDSIEPKRVKYKKFTR